MNEKEFNNYLNRLKTDEKAFDVLYNYYFPKIVMRILCNFHDEELSKDVAHEFFRRLLDMEQIDYIENPNAWVWTSVDNIAKTMYGKNKMTEPLENAKNESIQDTYEYELFGDYWEKLKSLDENTRRIIIMKVIDGYRFNEIAATMELEPATVRQKYSRGMKRLRKL